MRLRKSIKKSLSATISSVIILVGTIAIGALYFSWIKDYSITTLEKEDSEKHKAHDCLYASASIKKVREKTGGGGIDIVNYSLVALPPNWEDKAIMSISTQNISFVINISAFPA